MGLIASGALPWSVMASGTGSKDVKIEILLSGVTLSGYVTPDLLATLQTTIAVLELRVVDLEKKIKISG